MTLTGCKSCHHHKQNTCPHERPEDCPVLAGHMKGVERFRSRHEVLVGDGMEMHESDATRRLVELARARETDTMRREHPIAYAIEVLKAAGFSTRQIARVTRSDVSKTVISRGMGPFKNNSPGTPPARQ